jgi:two-component system response regulator HydG
MAYDWPGNIRELMNALLNASIQARGRTILPVHFPQITAGVKTSKASTGETFPPMTDVEKVHILEALEATGGNKRETARLLGISRDTLYRKMKKYGIPLASQGDSDTAGP